MKVIIIGGVAAGASAAAKLKRVNKDTEVVVYEKSNIISFGACGLPYYVGEFFKGSNNMIARTPEDFEKTGVKVKVNHEVLDVDFNSKSICRYCRISATENYSAWLNHSCIMNCRASFKHAMGVIM